MAPLVDELAHGRHGDAARAGQRRPDAARRRRHASAQGRRRRASESSRTPRRSRWPAHGWAGRSATSSWSAPSPGRPRRSSRRCSRGRRIVAYVTGADGAAQLAAVLARPRLRRQRLHVLEQLGGPAERRTTPPRTRAVDHVADPLHVVAIEVAGGRRPSAHARGFPTTRSPPTASSPSATSARSPSPRSVRARTSCCGTSAPATARSRSSGCGPSVPRGPIAVEPRESRAARIERTRSTLGVPHLQVAPRRRPGRPGRPPRARRRLRRRRHHHPRPARRLLGRAARGRPPRRQHGHARGRADRRSPPRDAHGGTLTRIDIAHADPSAPSPAGARR